VNVTGEAVVAPFAGEMSVAAPPPHCGGATVNRLVVERSELQLANFASTYQSMVPAGTIRVTDVSLVPAVSEKVAPLIEVKSSYDVAFGTALHLNVTDGSVFTAPLAGAVNVAGVVPHCAFGPTVNFVSADRVLQSELKIVRTTARYEPEASDADADSVEASDVDATVLYVAPPSLETTTSYRVPPLTAVHENPTGRVGSSVSPLTGDSMLVTSCGQFGGRTWSS